MGLEEEFTGYDCYLWLRGDIAVPPAREDCDIVGLFDFARTGEPNKRNPKLLPIGDGFGFLLFFGDLS